MVERSILSMNDPLVHRTNSDGTENLSNEGQEYDIDRTPLVYYSIPNNPGARLPATGGPGTTMFYVTGIGLIALAVLLLLRKREKETL